MKEAGAIAFSSPFKSTASEKEYEKEKKHNNTAYSTDYEISLTWFGVALYHPTITRVPAQ